MPTGPRHLRRRLRGAFTSVLGRMLEPEPALGAAAAKGAAAADEILRCPGCREHSLCPTDREPEGELAWWIRCRCGNCGVWVEAVVSNRMAAALDLALAGQLDVIRRAADTLELERTERVKTETDAFIAALQRDRIRPADFFF